MNNRNVLALQEILATTAPPGLTAWQVRQLAEYLTARGVLVPAAMSHEDIDELEDHLYPGGIDDRKLRADLGRIARGEPS
jgi:hypothetical protein